MPPFRVDLVAPPADAIDRLQALGALDIDITDAGVAAILPERVRDAGAIAAALGMPLKRIRLSSAVARDEESTWIITQRPIRIGRLLIVPADVGSHAPPIELPAEAKHVPAAAAAGGTLPITLRLVDSRIFGSGCHPTTALCLEAVDEAVSLFEPTSVLDVGTGSGILALAALALGVPLAVAVDVEAAALDTAAQNAHVNGLDDRLDLVRGDVTAVAGLWPLVVANVAAAPLMDMAPELVQRLAHRGRLVLSGISSSVAPDVERVYRRAGLHPVSTRARDGWVALVLDASW
ncbi:MAG TPA: 50S ribosomal protein L11 methyltransferase [Vicinamibacterales bacterium]|nr:50S ribosomal protein L11 methyltransferase [Vicinamibacterales bacterium]